MPIRSTLPVHKERFRSIVAQFVETLDKRILDLNEANKQGNTNKVVELAHSLIGAAGNCGLALLAKSATDLQNAALEENADKVSLLISEIRGVSSRIELPDDHGQYSTQPEQEIKSIAIDDSADDGPILSTLPVHKAKFHTIVSGFVDNLDSRFDAIENALNNGDHDSLTQLAHAIKGASGNCGFAKLAETASKLESLARKDELETAPDLVRQMRSIQSRIEMPSIR